MRRALLNDKANEEEEDVDTEGNDETKSKEINLEDPEVQEKLKFVEMDYVKWLQCMHEFWNIPRFCKYKDPMYEEYLKSLTEYLSSFITRSQPLQRMDDIMNQYYFTKIVAHLLSPSTL